MASTKLPHPPSLDAGTKFIKTALALEAALVADMLRTCASELDALIAQAPDYEPGTLRRKVRALELEAVAALAPQLTGGDL